MKILKQSYSRGKKYGITLYVEVTDKGALLWHIDDLTNGRPCGGTYNMKTKKDAMKTYNKRIETYKLDNITLIEQL